MVNCQPCGTQDPSLILSAGASFSHPFVFAHGGIKEIQSSIAGAGSSYTTVTCHCLEVGDRIILIHKTDGCPDENPICGEVTAVADDFNFTTNITTTSNGGTNGFVAKALGLQGIRLEGSIYNRIPSAMGPVGNVLAYGFAGSDEVLLTGICDVKLGDLISIPSQGIVDATVTAVYVADETPTAIDSAETATGQPSNNSTSLNIDCGTCPKPTITEAQTTAGSCTNLIASGNCQGDNCQTVLIKIDQTITADFTEATDFSRSAKLLASFSTKYLNGDTICGVIYNSLKGLDTAALKVSGYSPECFNEAIEVGFYSISLVRGYGGDVPCWYPQCKNYDSDVLGVRCGKVYVKPDYFPNNAYMNPDCPKEEVTCIPGKA